MKLAYVSLQGSGRTDALIVAVADRLQADGVRLAGTVQHNHERPDRARCDMDLRILPDGPTVRISEDRGGHSRGCHLDSGVLEQAVLDVQRRLEGADILIVNKFGKRESEGKGLVPAIADAVFRGLPVLIGVNERNHAALMTFAGHGIIGLHPDVDDVCDWCLAASAPASRTAYSALD